MTIDITLPASVLTKSQKKTEGWKEHTEHGTKYRIRAEIRFDDQCNNGHNSFAITGETQRQVRNGRWVEDSFGRLHDEIEKHFPHLKPFIKWRLTSTDGPMRYIANTVYLASDRDCNGLRKGERRQIRNGKTGLPCLTLEQIGPKAEQYIDSETKPTAPLFEYAPWRHEGRGKERELDEARAAAVWPEATNEELSAPPEKLKAKLAARLPALMQAFKADMIKLGFVY